MESAPDRCDSVPNDKRLWMGASPGNAKELDMSGDRAQKRLSSRHPAHCLHDDDFARRKIFR